MTQQISPPPLYLAGLEGFRAVLSAGQLFSDRSYLTSLPKGDGHSVLVLPGFLAGDYSTIPIRYFLKQWGYDAQRWRLGMNLGLNKRRDLEALMAKELKKHFKKSGRKVSIVGWSLGGVYARELARNNPEMVRCVVTMGSPIGDATRGTLTGGIYEIITRTDFDDPEFQAKIKAARKPVKDIPCTAIFSRTDGIVSWKIATEKESDIAENIEVKSAHTGLGLNPAVMFALADRLRQDEDDWKKFDKTQSDRFSFK